MERSTVTELWNPQIWEITLSDEANRSKKIHGVRELTYTV